MAEALSGQAMSDATHCSATGDGVRLGQLTQILRPFGCRRQRHAAHEACCHLLVADVYDTR